MTVHIPLYVLYLPAAFALLYKFYLLHFWGQSFFKNRMSKTLLALILVLTTANIIELVGYRYAGNPEEYDLFLRIYYLSLFSLLALLLQLSLLAAFKKLSVVVDVINFGSVAVIWCFLLFTDLIIAGSQSNGYTVTRIPGTLYWIPQMYGLFTPLVSLMLLIYCYFKTDQPNPTQPNQKVQTIYLMLAVFSLALPLGVAIIAMAFGYQINAAFILPIGISFFLGFITHGILNDKLFDIRFWIPFTTRRKLYKALKQEFSLDADGSNIPARERRKSHEELFIRKMVLNYGNTLTQREIAKIMGISESALSKKRKEYNIKI